MDEGKGASVKVNQHIQRSYNDCFFPLSPYLHLRALSDTKTAAQWLTVKFEM